MSNKSGNKIAARAITASLVVAGTLAAASQGMAMENWRNNPYLNGINQHPDLVAQSAAKQHQIQVRMANIDQQSRASNDESRAANVVLNNKYDQKEAEEQAFWNFLRQATGNGVSTPDKRAHAEVLTRAKNAVARPILANLITQSVGQPMDQRIQAITNYMNQNGL